MLTDRLQPRCQSHLLRYLLIPLFCICNAALVWASVFSFPEGALLSVPETYELSEPQPGKFLDVTYKPDLNISYINFNDEASLGWLKLQSVTGQEAEAGALGDLEVFVLHRKGYELPASNDLAISWVRSDGDKVAASHLSFCKDKACKDKACKDKACKDKACKKREPDHSEADLTESEEYRSVTVHSEFTEQTGKQLIRSYTLADVPKTAELFKHPVVQFDDMYCKIGNPSEITHCQHISAVVIRFVPYGADRVAELAIHILDSEVVAEGETVLRGLAQLLSNDAKPMWKQILGSLRPYTSEVDKDGVERGYPIHSTLPLIPENERDIQARLKQISVQEDDIWIHGTCSGTMYCGDKDFYQKQSEVFSHFSASNALQVDMNPISTKMQAEIVSMITDLQGGESVQTVEDGIVTNRPSGHITPGGTYSSIAAMDAFVADARARKIKRPVILVADTVHPSIRKSGKKLNFEIIKVKTSPDTKVMPVDEVRRLIELYDGTGEQSDGLPPRQIIGVVGSAPNYSYGISDPIGDISDLVTEVTSSGRMMHFHVDSCMGGIIFPFARVLSKRVNSIICSDLRARLGDDSIACPEYNLPKPLLQYPGVSSFSADLHKYGYSIKGVSVIAFREQSLHRRQFYAEEDWDGGALINAGMGGSSSGGLIAAAYFAMTSLGLPGYLEKAADIMLTAGRFQNIVRTHPELEIIGDPSMCFAFKAADIDKLNIFHIADVMKSVKPKWRFNHLQNPKALHFCVTGPQTRTDKEGAEKRVLFKDLPALKALEQELKAEGVKHSTEYKLERMAEILEMRLEEEESIPTRMFGQRLAEALPEAIARFGAPSMSGTLYGLGATGIEVDNRILRKALLESGLLMLLQAEGEFDLTYESTGYWTKRIANEAMHWPAY